MSGRIVEKFWHLGNYRYVYYRFELEQLCREAFKKPCLMLDAGCGDNTCSLSYVPKKAFVIGVDVNRWNVVKSHRRAKERGCKNFNFILADITSLPFRHKTFDLAVCVNVLEHVLDNREAINEVSRTCKSGAEFVGSTSNLLNPLMMFDSFAPKSLTTILTERFAGKHYQRHSRFSFEKLIKALNDANFQVSDAKLLGFPELSSKKLPYYVYLWIIFDRLTKKKPLNLLKENIVFHALKKVSSARATILIR